MIPEIEQKKSKRGLIKYEKNPFIYNAVVNTKTGIKRISDKSGMRMMVVNNTGEVLAPAGFWQTQNVDKTQFVKLYINGVKAFRELTGAGAKVFEVLYLRVQEGVGKDTIYLSYVEIDQKLTPMSKATFMKGMKELILKGFIAESMAQNKYFLNPDYMWNGDRLAFVQEYRKVNNKDNFTGDLFNTAENLQLIP